MTALIVLCVIILLLSVICVLPLALDIVYDDELTFKVKCLGITLFNNKKTKQNKKRKKKKDKITDQKQTPKKDNIFKKTYKEKGLVGSIKYFSQVIKLISKNVWWLIKRFKFKRLKFELNVATDDAAKTAVCYGEVCTAIYPILSLLRHYVGFNPKGININADFEKTKPEFKISLVARAMLIIWLITGISILSQFLKLQRKESEKHERK